MSEDLNHIFKRLGPNITAEFYPYTNIKHTIRRRKTRIHMRISDVFVAAPTEVLLSLGRILLAKLDKTRVHQEDRSLYRKYVARNEVQRKAFKIRSNRRRKTKIIKGAFKDLKESFERVNEAYFDDTLKRPVLTWSGRKAKRTLGRYDPEKDVVTISTLLDSPEIPDELLDFIMYHELLHKKHGITEKGGRRRIHTPQFKRDEKKFRTFREMKALMEKLARS